MNQFIFIAGYCLFCFMVSVMAMKFLRTAWVYFLVSAMLPAMVLVGVDMLWRGYLDAWADIAFVVSSLIAFACAVVYYAVRRVVDKRVK